MAAKRISSIFSMGSNVSDQSSESRISSSINPARPPREQSQSPVYASGQRNPVNLSLPDLRPTSHLQNLHNEQSSGLTPPFDATILPRIEDDDVLLNHPPPLLKPLPLRAQSPGGGSLEGSRPVSRGNPLDSRPASRGNPFDSRSSSRPPSSRPPSRPPSQPASRPASPIKFRPQTPTARPLTPTTEAKLAKRRSWMPGKLRKAGQDGGDHVNSPQAWMITPNENIPYDVSGLASFHRVPELWNDHGDTLVYLHAREGGRGPSFKIDSALFAASKKLVYAAHGGMQEHSRREPNDWQQQSFMERTQHLTTFSPSERPGSSTQGSSKGSRSVSDDFEDLPIRRDIHLCLPLPLQVDLTDATSLPTTEDVETLVTMRNVIAFLARKPLVATPKQSSVFIIFLKIADVMQRYDFTNLNGSTLGEEAAGNFAKSIQEFGLADVRSSREKTVEGLILGERMKSWELYNEGFVHAVGKYDDINGLRSPKFPLISDLTRKRLERANIDLYSRVRNIETRLEDFDFPSLFAGIANSSTSSESKIIRFKDWKSAYMSMRRHITSLYKHQYGAWPPKAKSKKNDFEESGLNRLLLRDLYKDFSDLYDILVDRTSLTTRTADIPPHDPDDPQEPAPGALRRILDEYDRSTPPVQPPVPFDTPRLPSLFDTRRGFDTLDPKKQKKESVKRLRDDEINKALMQSYNRDSMKATPFLEAFMAYERRTAHGKSIEEIADLRYGQWIFMYAVIQALPLVVVDAPGVRWTKGVEYFLCEVPKGSPPWVQESASQKQSVYRIAGGSAMVTLPADVVEHSVDGIYRRSHCWEVADKWAGFSEVPDAPSQSELDVDDLLPPVMPSAPGSRTASQSPDRRRASMALGLEQMPLPPGVTPSGARPVSVYDPSKSFAAILSEMDGVGKKKK